MCERRAGDNRGNERAVRAGSPVQGVCVCVCVCERTAGITEGTSGQYVQGLLYRVFVCVCVSVQPGTAPDSGGQRTA